MYILMVVISALFLGCYDVLRKISLKKSSVYEVLFFYCASAFLVSLLFIGKGINVDVLDVLFILLKSLIIVVNWALVLKCMKKIDVAIVVGFSLLNTLFVVFGSWIFFNENLTWAHFVSLIFMGIGIILITRIENKDKEQKISNDYKYLWFLFFSSMLGASSGLLDKYILNYRQVSNNSVLTLFMLFTSVIYGCIYFYKNKKIEFKNLKNNLWIVATGASIAFADIFYYYSITMEDAQLSLISILRKTSVLVATILASVFLREKYLFKKLGVLIFMLIGVGVAVFF